HHRVSFGPPCPVPGHSSSPEAKNLPHGVADRRQRAVFSLHDLAVMTVAPVPRRVERTCPDPDLCRAGSRFLTFVVAEGNSPARLDLGAVEIRAAGLAVAKQTVIAIPLPAAARDRPAGDQAHQRLARKRAT